MICNGLNEQNANYLNADKALQAVQMLAVALKAVLEFANITPEKIGLPHVTPCHNSPVNTGLTTLGDLVVEFIRAKAKSGRSMRYLRALRVSLKSFARDRKNVPIENITVADVEAWLDKNGWAPRTCKGYLSDVRVMFNFAVRRRLLDHNPAAGVELPVQDSQPPGIHTPDQVRTVLEFARGYSLPICRALAIRYFAGLRSSEANRLEEGDIREGFIEVTAAKAKTRRRRLVQIAPNLAAWLQLGGALPIHDVSNRWRWFTAELRDKHQVPWPHNVTRHSFVSYHLAAGQSAAKTALEAGHTEQMLFAHYRELVTPAAAKEFWGISPK